MFGQMPSIISQSTISLSQLNPSQLTKFNKLSSSQLYDSFQLVQVYKKEEGCSLLILHNLNREYIWQYYDQAISQSIANSLLQNNPKINLYKIIFMKQIIVLFIAFWMLGAKCKKDDYDGIYFGYGKAIINGNTINFDKIRANLYNSNPDSISVVLERWTGGIKKEGISFFKIKVSSNSPQPIHKAISGLNLLVSNYNTVTADGDVVCDYYYVFEPDSLQNHITITSFNSVTKEVRGVFQATYLIDPLRTKCNPSAPDTIRIRNGEFYTKIL
jgi:hypothetical protein